MPAESAITLTDLVFRLAGRNPRAGSSRRLPRPVGADPDAVDAAAGCPGRGAL